jgi:hypothetical protein
MPHGPTETHDPTNHDCWGCTVREKLHNALTGVDPTMPVGPAVTAVVGELTLMELCQLARLTLEAWAEDERPAPRRARGRRTVEAVGG